METESEEYEHGILWMDWQHAGLIKEFNTLHEACREGGSALTIMKTSKALERYIEEHFGLEEAYMKQFGYPDFKRHQMEHLTFRQKFQDFHETGLDGEDKVCSDLVLILTEWIMKHIMITDCKVAEFLASKGIK